MTEKDGIYYLDGHEKFGYSDGDQAEEGLLKVLRNSEDVSIQSRELDAHSNDWVNHYHFGRSRSLAYQSLKFPPDALVLEVGSGSGSITRLLAERACEVMAVEGSPAQGCDDQVAYAGPG